jgi:hypothetical protein
MKKTSSGRFGWILRQGCMAVFISLFMIVFASTTVFANTVNIYDSANVLNQSSVKRAASALSKPIDIYSVSSSMSNATFDQTAKNNARKNANLIVMAFNANHVAIVGGTAVPISTSQYQDAVNAFTDTMRNGNHNYTNATVAALNSLQNSLNSGSRNSSSGIIPGVGGAARSGSIFSGTFCCIGLIVLIILGLFAVTRFRRRRADFTQPYGTTNYSSDQPYGGTNYPPQSYGARNYPPNQYYQDPNMQQPNRGGMNPLAAGGIGAALGGLFGYGLGRESGRDRNPGGGEGGFGAGASGDFANSGTGEAGGGASGDFGNSDTGGGFGNSGASGDFGNSDAGGGFGGGDDSGGDIGGGAGGNF